MTNTRISFSKNTLKVNYPDFLELQLKSFRNFFKLESDKNQRINEGLYKVFKDNFPVSDVRNIYNLEFIDYFIDPPKYNINECIKYGLTYSVSLKAKLKLSCNDDEHEEFKTTIQDVYLGSIPYMNDKGAFIINGIERVVVAQLHRSPGVFFAQSRHTNGIKLYSARIIPFKGAWIEFATDMNYIMYAYIDRKKKFPVTTLLRAIGYSTDKDILNLFNISEEVIVNRHNLESKIGFKLASKVLKNWIEDFVDEDTGEVISLDKNQILLDRGSIISKDNIDIILDSGAESVMIVNNSGYFSAEASIIYNTLQKDIANSEKEAVEYIYRQLRNTEPPDEETARGIIDKLFFSDKRYDLGNVGRFRINKKLKLEIPYSTRTLTKKDIIEIVRYLIKLINSKEDVDDIDHLSNRRVRTVGEQLYTQFNLGFSRMVRNIKERMNVRDNEVFSPSDLINARALLSVINSFFGTNQLSQFLDQTNVLSEITHKRRLSALGPGGLSRERAGFEVRDVHYTHYGRLCTIETPEGPNIGLISSLCVYAKINDLGFIETPYRKVINGKVNVKNEDIVYLSAEEEDNKIITQANTPINKDGCFINKEIKARSQGDFPVVSNDKISLMDVASNQTASIASSLIPFLEHDDANRALMGSNMQRQAVPLLYPEAPIVGTGLESDVVQYSRSMINAEQNGIVKYVDSSTIIVEYLIDKEYELTCFDKKIKKYNLTKFKKTNQNTCINLKPIVKKGDHIVKNQVICEGYSTQSGELALGRNLKVAFMPWQGFNFEDAIVISENVVKNDLFTSIHIEEYELDVRDTKRGKEEFSYDIPNVSEESIGNLDENGIIKVGSNVKPGDILIGKITPKGEVDPTPEEKLLRALFGDKAGDVKDASLKASQSVYGTVIDTQLLTKIDKSNFDNNKFKNDIKYLDNEYNNEVVNLKDSLTDKIITLLDNNLNIDCEIKDLSDNIIFDKEKTITKDFLSKIDYSNTDLNFLYKKNKLINKLINNYLLELKIINHKYKKQIFRVTVGDDLHSGILKKAKVVIAQKRRLKVGDKIAGRHGNKGIIAKIVRQEDMPFSEDGEPIDIILNPLGVPSRMNIGQIYETVLGWAGKILNVKFSSPIFDGASYEEVDKWINKANLPKLGATYLYNGLTGEKFHSPTTVGIIYIMKLGHMVDDKMHARSIGPYSLVMQQPLGGKSQFGGQRIGEMEVWALEAFGAANILREILTLKSDDISSRAKTYGAIVKGKTLPTPNVPESFNVLVHELIGLCLEIKFK